MNDLLDIAHNLQGLCTVRWQLPVWSRGCGSLEHVIGATFVFGMR